VMTVVWAETERDSASPAIRAKDARYFFIVRSS
jgi:hypothetical protein